MAQGIASLSNRRITEPARKAINEIVNGMFDNLIANHDPSSRPPLSPLARRGNKEKPFLYALFPALARASTIERSMSSSMGTTLENIAKEIALGVGLLAETQKEVAGSITPGVVGYIDQVTRPRRASDRQTVPPDINTEIDTVRNLNEQGARVAQRTTLDLLVQTHGTEYYFDLKTPQPNSEQPPAMKKRLLTAKALRLPTVVHAYAVFYYNPNGLDGSFNVGRAYLHYPDEVLVGREFWDMLAGRGTYEDLINILDLIGNDRRSDLESLL